MLAPPYSSLTVTPRTPKSPSFFHISSGNWLLWSTSAAIGAISFWAKWRTLSRRATRVSSRSKLKLLSNMVGFLQSGKGVFAALVGVVQLLLQCLNISELLVQLFPALLNLVLQGQ